MCKHPPDDLKGRDGQRTDMQPNTRDPEKEIRPIKGLCMNCAHSAYCLLPRPESGVWHCEEYEVGR